MRLTLTDDGDRVIDSWELTGDPTEDDADVFAAFAKALEKIGGAGYTADRITNALAREEVKE